MSPQILQLLLFGIEQAIQEVPALVSNLRAIFAAGSPTAADFDALRAKVASESYGEFVLDSDLNGAAPAAAQVSSGPVL